MNWRDGLCSAGKNDLDGRVDQRRSSGVGAQAPELLVSDTKSALPQLIRLQPLLLPALDRSFMPQRGLVQANIGRAITHLIAETGD